MAVLARSKTGELTSHTANFCQVRCAVMIDSWTKGALVAIGLSAVPAPGVAQDDLDVAPGRISLQVTTDPSMIECRKLETVNPGIARLPAAAPDLSTMISTSIRLSTGRGCRITPAAPRGRKRATGAATAPTSSARPACNGEQQIYVDPRYGGRATTPLGLDPFRVRGRRALDRRQPHAAGTEAGAVQQRIHLGHPDHAGHVLAKVRLFRNPRQDTGRRSACGRRSGCSPTTAAGRRRSTCWKAAGSGPATS